MIHSFKTFEELRMNRISLENRKFDALANMSKKPVLVANAENKIIYMNGQLYNLMRVQSEDVIGKLMNETLVPKSIIECYKMAIKRRSKIENMKIIIERTRKKVALLSLGKENTDRLTDERLFISLFCALCCASVFGGWVARWGSS